MTTFLRIPDKIQQLSEGGIQRYFIQPIIPTIFILLGMIMIWIGGWEVQIGEGESFVMTVLGLIAILISVVILFRKRAFFVVKSSMTRIKPIRINIDIVHQQDALDFITQDNINEILKLKTTDDSPLCLEIWYNEKHNKVYSQMLYYFDAGMRPISLVHVTNSADLDTSLLN